MELGDLVSMQRAADGPACWVGWLASHGLQHIASVVVIMRNPKDLVMQLCRHGAGNMYSTGRDPRSSSRGGGQSTARLAVGGWAVAPRQPQTGCPTSVHGAVINNGMAFTAHYTRNRRSQTTDHETSNLLPDELLERAY